MTTPPNIVLFPDLPAAEPIADSHRLAVEQGDTLAKGALFSSIKAWLFAGFLQGYANGAAGIRARADNFYAIESRRASEDANPGAISLEKSRGTIATPAPIVAGDGIASVAGRAWDGSAWNVGGQFRFDCVTFAGAGNFTTRFQLQLRTGTGLSTVMTTDSNGVTTFTSLTEFGVGIQTTTASAQTGLLSQPVAIFDNTNPTVGNGLGLRFRIADAGGTLRNAVQVQAIATAKDSSSITPRLAVVIGTTERATIANDGRLGLNVTVPAAILDGGDLVPSTAFTYLQLLRKWNTAAGATNTNYAVEQIGANVVGLEVFDHVNTKGDLRLQPFGGRVSVGGAPTTTFHAHGPIRHAVYTVATLPAAATVGAGTRAAVTDANATTFNSIVVGGGSNFVPVISDGTNWRVG